MAITGFPYAGMDLRGITGAEALELSVAQGADPAPARTYGLADLPRKEACARFGCQGGGLDLHVTAACLAPGEHHFNCLGYVGAGFTKRPCENHFRVVLKITRAAATAEPTR